jgi:predicted polyphosphate/ATP-dependent NAD kinase
MHTRRAGHVVARPLNCGVRRTTVAAAIHRSVSNEELLKLVPNGLRVLAAGVKGPGPYSVAVFKEQVVRIGALKRALKELSSSAGDTVVLVGSNFTEEALALAHEHDAQVLEQSHTGWTETRYDEIKTVIASPKKRPAHSP